MTKHKKVSSHHHENVKHHAKALVAATDHITDSTVAAAREKLSAVMESVGEYVEDMEESAREKAKQADEFVHEKPYHAAAIALGIGAVLGFLFGRRK